MAWTVESALADELVTVIRQDDRNGSYDVRIGDLPTVVTITLKKARSGHIEYTTSHAIKTPEQMGPYRTSLPFGDDAGDALHRAIGDITSHYRMAVNRGHIPADDWLKGPGEY